MTLFQSDRQHDPPYMSVSEEQKSVCVKPTGVKRPSSSVFGVCDYQCVPSKQLRLASSSRRSRNPPSARSSRPASSSRMKLKMEDLQVIKRELTVIKLQIDGLLESLEQMERPRRNSTALFPSQDGGVEGSAAHQSASSPEASPRSVSPHSRADRESPELGEASDNDEDLLSTRYESPHF